MNTLIVLSSWCTSLMDVVVSRMAPMLIRSIMDLLLVVPAKYIIQCMETSRQLIHFILVKVFNIEVDASYDSHKAIRIRISHVYIEADSEPDIAVFLEKEKELLPNRRRDFAVVIVDSLFRFYGPAHELARETITLLSESDPEQLLFKEIVEQLRGRTEFELVGKLTPQIQMR